MVSTTSNVEALHFEHRLWMNELSFFTDELRIYEHRLEELTKKSLDRDTLSQLEQFQNQFIRQKEVLDTLEHDIHLHEQRLGQALEKGEEAPEEPALHESLGNQMEAFRNIYAELKQNFKVFIAKNK